MGKRLLSIFCLIALFVLWVLPVEALAASGPADTGAPVQDTTGEFITEGFEGIRIHNADEALALLTGEGGGGYRGFDTIAPTPTYTLLDTAISSSDQSRAYKFQQTYHGIPLYGMIRIVNTDRNGYVQALSGQDDTIVAGMDLPNEPVLTREQAVDTAVRSLGLTEYELSLTDVTLCYYAKLVEGDESLYHLAYYVKLSGFEEHGAFYWAFMIDAVSGNVLKSTDILKEGVGYGGSGYGVLGDYKEFPVYRPIGDNREQLRDNDRRLQVTDMNNSYDDSKLGSISKDADNHWDDPRQGAEVDAYVYLADTYDYFYNTHGWRSYDNNRADIYGCTHYGVYECNAFWNGRGFYFGDGDAHGRITLALSGAPDVVAHEFMHAVTENRAGLEYFALSGALDEAFSDIFGAFVQDYVYQTSNGGRVLDDTSFYRCAELIWRDGPALRDMANPSQYGMPGHMNQYRHMGAEDNGGVHVNCGIPCRAFYIMGQSLAREQLADIWFQAQNYLAVNSDFWDARAATVLEAGKISATAANSVAAAWDSVGVTAVNPDSHGDTLDQAASYAYGDTVQGSINWAGDMDCFVFTPTGNGYYEFYTTGSTDTKGGIADSSGNFIVTDDDSGDGYNFKVGASLQKGKTYYIVVAHADVYGRGNYTLKCTATMNPITSLSATLSPASPQELGASVIWRATAGPETPEYQFQVRKSGTSKWTVVQSYWRNSSIQWTPTQVGTYDLCVWARTVGRTTAYDREWTSTYTITEITPLPGVSLSASAESPQEYYTPIVLKATPEGPASVTSRAEYLFRAKLGTKWTTLRTWGSGTYEWIPTAVGKYTLEVQARTKGRTTVDQTAVIENYEIEYPPPLDGVSLGINAPSPERNTPITLTATPSGAESHRAQYMFRVKQGNKWTTLQDWSSDHDYEWIPTKTGDYTLEVQARTQGRVTTDWTDCEPFTVVDIYPLDDVTLKSDPAGLKPAGTAITLTATAEGVHANTAEYAYQWSTDGKKWTNITKGFGSDNTVTYTPLKDAVYQFRVQARSPGRTTVDQQAIVSQRFYIGPMPVEGVSLEVTPETIQETNKPVALTAAATGDAAGNAQYQFRIKQGSKYTTIRTWDADNTCEWTPTKPGAYTIEVQARSVGRTTIDASASQNYRVENIFPLTGVTLESSPAGLQAAGTEITLKATAEGPYADTAQYAFQWSTDGKKWTNITKGFSNSNTVSYIPTKDSVYQFRVQARSAGRTTVDQQAVISQRFYIGPMPVEGVALAADPAGVQQNAVKVTLTATATGDAAGDAEYLFRMVQGQKYTVLRDWGDSGSCEWVPDKTGTYTLEVQARTKGRTTIDASASIAGYNIVLPPALQGVEIRADRQGPQEIHTYVILTAAAQGNQSETDRAEYLFRVKLGNRWTTLQNWGQNHICLWRPDKTGTYTLEVQARTKGRTTVDASHSITGYEITLPPQLGGVALTADVSSPQENGIAITLNATPSGAGSDRAEYLFRVKLGNRWTTLQNWGQNHICLWRPDKTGTYTLDVQARTKGRTTVDASHSITGYEITLPPQLGGVALATDVSSPQEKGTAITLNATPSGAGSERAEYLFRVKLGSKWTTLQNWSGNDTCVWTPSATGTYTLEVQARTKGRTTVDASHSITGYEITIPPQLGGVALAADVSSPQENGTEITLNATPSGAGSERAEYLFRVKLGSKWTTLQNWSGDNTCVWTPSKTGTYTLDVQARTKGRTTVDASHSITGYEITLPPQLGGVALAADVSSPQENGTAITLNATPSGAGSDRAEYLFRVKLGNKWTTLQNWSVDNTCIWTPSATGTYTLEVQARTKGRTTVDASHSITGYEITLPPQLGGVALATDVSSPQEKSTEITLNATPSGAGSERAEYLFRVKLGSKWTTLQNWSVDNTCIWTPSATGTYTLEVQARTKGRTTIDAVRSQTFIITGILPVTAVSLEMEPQEYGVKDFPVTLAARADRPYAEYQFFARHGEEPYLLLRDWSAEATCAWIPPEEGHYTLLVMSRARQQSAAQAVCTIPCRVLSVPPVKTVTIHTDPEGQQELGASVEITAQADQPDAEYQFAYKTQGGSYVIVQDFSTDSTLTWNPEAVGIYIWRVRARTDASFPEGQAEAYLEYGIYVPVEIPDPGLRAALETALDKEPGELITDIDMASITDLDCSGMGVEDLTGIEYAIHLTHLDLSDNRIGDLSPLEALLSGGGLTQPGSHVDITLNGLDCRAGTPAEAVIDTLADAGVIVEYLPQHPAVGYVELSADPSSPQDVGTAVTFTATADQPGVEYRFTVDDTVLREWSDDNTIVWTPGSAGDYVITVQARTWMMPETEVVNSMAYQAIPVSLPSVSLEADPSGSMEEGNAVHLSADAGEEDAWYRFQFMMEGYDWITIQDWSQSASADWTPIQAGDYILRVQARRDGRPWDRVDASQEMPFKVIPLPLTGDLVMEVFPEDPSYAGDTVSISVSDLGPGAEYQFTAEDQDGSVIWTRDWGDENIATWVPDCQGAYTLSARARAKGRSGFDLEITAPYTVLPAPIDAVFLEADPESPQEIGTPVTLTASSEGVCPEYCFSVQPEEGEYTVIQEWSDANTCIWVPETPGEYVLRVEVREAGAIEADSEKTLLFSVPWPPIDSFSMTVGEGKVFQHQDRQILVMTNAKEAEYRYSVWNPDATWTTLQDWSTDLECEWTPLSAGDYILKVEGRSIGAENADCEKTIMVTVYPSMPAQEWAMFYGGNHQDESMALCRCSDGGFVIAGSTRSTDIPGYKDPYNQSSLDAYLAKVDENGNMQWQRCFGRGKHDYFNDVVETSDGGYIAVGTSLFDHQNVDGSQLKSDVYLVKVSADGNHQWHRYYGSAEDDRGYSIIKAKDGNYIVAGQVADKGFLNTDKFKSSLTGVDGFVMKINENGQYLWITYLGGSERDYINDIAEAANGDIIIAGETSSSYTESPNHGYNDGWIARLNSSGVVQWNKTVGGSSSDTLVSICAYRVGGQDRYTAVGYTRSSDGDAISFHGLDDGFIVSVDAYGRVLYSECLGGSDNDQLKDVIKLKNGGIALLGSSSSRDGDLSDMLGNGTGWVIRMNEENQILWQKCLFQWGSAICQTGEGGFMLTGCNANANKAFSELESSNCILLKLGPEGVTAPFSPELSFDQQSPQAAGTPIKIAGSSYARDIEYRFLVYNGAGVETVLQDWSSQSTVDWMPVEAGTYVVKIQARVPLYPQYVETDVYNYKIN